MPKLSILMPMRNAEAYIKETIQSLLAQSFSDFEIIVVNDGSDDNSQALVESFSDTRIKIFQGECRGISAALNLALSHAQGEYICRCDADDLFPDERLELQIAWLNSHPDYIAISGKFSSMDEKSRIISEFNTGDVKCDITRELLTGKTRTHLGTFLIKKTAINTVKGFRSYFVTAEDIDMQLRLAQLGSIGYIPDNMYFYRIHSASITHVQSSNKRVFFERLAREFLKQRLNEGQDLLQKGIPPLPPLVENKPSDTEQQIVGYIIGESWRLHKEGHKIKAITKGMMLCSKKPFKFTSWRNLVALIIKCAV